MTHYFKFRERIRMRAVALFCALTALGYPGQWGEASRGGSFLIVEFQGGLRYGL